MTISNQENPPIDKNDMEPKRMKMAKIVSTWLSKKTEDTEKVSTTPYTLGQIASGVEMGLVNQEIYFIVTEDPSAPVVTNRKTKINLPTIDTAEGKRLPLAYAVSLQVKLGATVEELMAIGDSPLVKLFTDHVNTTFEKGRTIPAMNIINIKDPTFGPFPIE